MRAAWFLLWALAVLLVLLPLLRRLGRGRAAGRPPARHDELVKDPVCQTWVVRSQAHRRGQGETAVYFCGAECARRYAGPGA